MDVYFDKRECDILHVIKSIVLGCICGDVKVDQDLVGALAADVMSEAIIRVVKGAESAYGFQRIQI